MTNDPFVRNPFRGVGRNDPCPCGSGHKFKKCCLGKSELELREAAWPSESMLPLPATETWDEIDPWDETDPFDEADTGYDPLVEPDPEEWLALGEQERIDMVMAYHESAGIEVPRAKLHAVMHVIVENQIAEGDALPVRRTAERLMTEGLDRHNAIHAVGSVLAIHLFELMDESREGDRFSNVADANAHYYAELERLTAESWLQSG